MTKKRIRSRLVEQTVVLVMLGVLSGAMGGLTVGWLTYHRPDRLLRAFEVVMATTE